MFHATEKGTFTADINFSSSKSSQKQTQSPKLHNNGHKQDQLPSTHFFQNPLFLLSMYFLWSPLCQCKLIRHSLSGSGTQGFGLCFWAQTKLISIAFSECLLRNRESLVIFFRLVEHEFDSLGYIMNRLHYAE